MTLPFGKHRGRDIRTVLVIDPGYLHWLESQTFVAKRFPLLRECLLVALRGETATSFALKAPIRAIADRAAEALRHRGFSEAEAEQMVTRLLTYDAKGSA